MSTTTSERQDIQKYHAERSSGVRPGPLRLRRFRVGQNVRVTSGPYRGNLGVYLSYVGDGYARVSLSGGGEAEICMDSLQSSENDPLRVSPERDALVEELVGVPGAHKGMLK